MEQENQRLMVLEKKKMEGTKIKYTLFRNNATTHLKFLIYNLANKYIRYVFWKISSAQAGTYIKLTI